MTISCGSADEAGRSVASDSSRSEADPSSAPTTGRAAGPVTIYVSADDVVAREVLAACTAETGVELLPAFDTEATKTTGLERRVVAERQRPRADLFWSSEGFSPVRLAAEGVLVPIPPAILAQRPVDWVDPGRRWFAFAARARCVVTRIDGAPPPASWPALAEPGLENGAVAALAIADPRFGTTRAHLAALADRWERDRAVGGDAPTVEAWLAGLAANGVRVLPGGNAATVDAVRRGEVAYALTDTDDALAAIARGAPLVMSLPPSLPGAVGGGDMLIPNTICAIAGGPGPRESVEKVLSWFASERPEEILCASASRNLPLSDEAVCERAFEVADPLEFDVVASASRAAALAVEAKRILEGGAPASAVDAEMPPTSGSARDGSGT